MARHELTHFGGLMIIEASHDDVDMIQLMRVLCRRELTVVLLLSNNGSDGEIYFRDGRIVHASSDGGLRGEAAALELLGWTSGLMRVAHVLELPQTTIDRELESLLLASSILQDERSAARESSCDEASL